MNWRVHTHSQIHQSQTAEVDYRKSVINLNVFSMLCFYSYKCQIHLLMQFNIPITNWIYSYFAAQVFSLRESSFLFCK